MAHAPFTIVSAHVAQVLFYPVGVLSLAALLYVLNALTRDDLPVEPRRLFWVGAAAIALSSRYLERDLAEAGPNTLLVAIVWVGIWAWSRGHAVTGGLLLGGAIALKLTAAIFVLYL
jgi:hypothetical protein